MAPRRRRAVVESLRAVCCTGPGADRAAGAAAWGRGAGGGAACATATDGAAATVDTGGSGGADGRATRDTAGATGDGADSAPLDEGDGAGATGADSTDTWSAANGWKVALKVAVDGGAETAAGSGLDAGAGTRTTSRPVDVTSDEASNT